MLGDTNNFSTQKNIKKDNGKLFSEKHYSSIKNLSNFQIYGGLRANNFFKKSEKNKPLISVITVCYNAQETLESTIQSVLNQNYDNIEFIIIDGNSSDHSLEIIRKYNECIDLWISEKDDGIYNAINKGILLSTGDIIGILNADDTYTKNALSLVKKYYLENNIDFLFGSVKKDRLLSGFHKKKIFWKFNIYPSHSSGFFISQKAQTITGLYDESFALHADYDLMYKLICKHKLEGMAMDRSDITGTFNNFGKSSKESKFSYFYEEFKIRKKNNQNIIFITFLFFLKIIYNQIYNLKIFKGILNKLKKLIKY